MMSHLMIQATCLMTNTFTEVCHPFLLFDCRKHAQHFSMLKGHKPLNVSETVELNFLVNYFQVTIEGQVFILQYKGAIIIK